MAARVVWLVANGLVRPDEVLGLTFTRKAAGELSERLVARLTTLREAGLWAPPRRTARRSSTTCPPCPPTTRTPGGSCASTACGSGSSPRAGCSPRPPRGSSPTRPSSRGTARWTASTKAESTVTTAVVDLAGELAEHLVDADGARRAPRRGRRAPSRRVPKGEGTRKRPHPCATCVGVLRAARRRSCRSLERYHDLKRSRDAMDFADQMALAARHRHRRSPQVGAAERGAVQGGAPRRVPGHLRGPAAAAARAVRRAGRAGSGHRRRRPAPVDLRLARGVLRRPSTASATTSRDPEPARVLHLSTSWRNDRAVLDAANVVAGPLAATTPGAGRAARRTRPGAGPGPRRRRRGSTTIEDEAAARRRLGREHGCARPGRRTAAVLCRKRSQFDPVVEALEARRRALRGRRPRRAAPHARGRRPRRPAPRRAGPDARRPAHAPAHRAVVPARRRRPRRPRRVGPGAPARRGRGDRRADLSPDAQRAHEHRRGARRPARRRRGSAARASACRRSPCRGCDGLGAAVRRLRALTGLGLPELVAEAEAALGLDIEVLARPGYSPGAARAHLDAFADVAATFAASADRADARRLPRLARGGRRRGARPRPRLGRGPARRRAGHDGPRGQGPGVGRRRGPGLVESSFPAHSAHPGQGRRRRAGATATPATRAGSSGWRRCPTTCAATAPACPASAGRDAHDWDSRRRRRSTASPAPCADHGIAEERRLAYVALTRARPDLLLTAHVWGAGLDAAGHLALPRGGARRRRRRRRARARGSTCPPVDDPKPQNPRTAEVGQRQLADARPRRPARERLARPGPRVVAGRRSPVPAHGRRRAAPTPGVWDAEVTMLLDERARRRRGRRRRRRAARAPVDLGAGLPRRRRRAVHPRPAPPDAAATGAADPPGHGVPRLGRGALRRAAFVDVDDLPGLGRRRRRPTPTSAALREARSSPASGPTARPAEVETSVETVVDGIAVRGRIDAVFEEAGPDGEPGWVVVDWKTGAPATGRPGRGPRACSSAAYRLAWARLRGVDRVSGCAARSSTPPRARRCGPTCPTLAEITRVLAAARPR